MLSFLHDQNFGEIPAEKAAQNTKPDQQYLTVASRSQQMRKSTMLLAALLVIGLVGLVLMIKKSSPQSASAADVNKEQVEIESAIARLTGVGSEMFSRMDEIVKKFYEFSGVPQVRVGELVKNPFQFELFLVGLGQNNEAPDSEVTVDLAVLRQQQMQQQAAKLHLLGIMRSDRGSCCMIDDKVLYEGDSIRNFAVSEIAENYVRLSWASPGETTGSAEQSKALEIVLKLSQ
jgi:preprotein translocase subunit SecG